MEEFEALIAAVASLGALSLSVWRALRGPRDLAYLENLHQRSTNAKTDEEREMWLAILRLRSLEHASKSTSEVFASRSVLSYAGLRMLLVLLGSVLTVAGIAQLLAVGTYGWLAIGALMIFSGFLAPAPVAAAIAAGRTEGYRLVNEATERYAEAIQKGTLTPLEGPVNRDASSDGENA